ncbi:MAG: hypothetical protein NTV86_20415 [Planctomycetota bacterium]|nr:hypothetical protein [Planctomycetota bacterium]
MRNTWLRVQAAALGLALVVLVCLVAARSGSGDSAAAPLADLSARLEAESAQLADARTQAQGLQKSYAALMRDLDAVRADRRQSEARVRQLQGQLDKASTGETQALADARNRGDTLQASFATVSRDLEALRAERRQSEARLAALQSQFDQASKADSQLLSQAQHRADVLYQVASNLASNLETVRAESRQADACLQELQGQLDQASRSSESAKCLSALLPEARRRAELLQQVQANLAHDLDAVRSERRQADACALQLRARLGQPAPSDDQPTNWLVGFLAR